MSKPKKKPQRQKKNKFRFTGEHFPRAFIIMLFIILCSYPIFAYDKYNIKHAYLYNNCTGTDYATTGGIPLSVSGTPINNPIVQGSGCQFSGSNQYYRATNLTATNLIKTIEIWVNPSNTLSASYPFSMMTTWGANQINPQIQATGFINEYSYVNSTGIIAGTQIFGQPKAATSQYIYTRNATHWLRYVNGTYTFAVAATQNFPDINNLCIGCRADNSGENFNGTVSRLTFFNETFTTSDVQDSYNAGAGRDWLTYNSTVFTGASYNISVITQPSDINTSTYEDINFSANVSYVNVNYTDLNNDSMNLSYFLNTSLNNGCALFFQQQCAMNTTAYIIKPMNKQNNTQFNTTLSDDEIFPAYYPYNYSVYNQNNNASYTLYNNNNIMFNVTNFSTQLQQFFISIEFQANNITSTSNNMLIYYCNSTYTSGNPALSSSCELIDTFGVTQSFNHGRHQTVPVTIQTIKKTQQSYFIFVSTANTQSNGWRFMYVTNASYNNQSFKIGNYNTWSITDNIFDIHIHQFNNTDKLQYFASFTDNRTPPTTATSQIYYDFYNITNQAPSAPNYILPSCPNNYSIDVNGNVSINFSWTTSVDLNNDTPYYSLYLLSTLLSANQTNTTYNFLFHPSFITYTSFIRVCDIYNACDIGTLDCSINICVPSWQLTTQPCVADVKLISYQDINNCNSAYNLSINNGTYTNCTAIIHNQQEFSDDQKIIIILIILMIIAAALSFYSTYFLVLDAGLSILLGISLIYYHYPDATFVAAFFFGIIFLLAAIFTKIKRK